MSVNAIEAELQSLRSCALDLLVGDLLGSGATRRVYALRHNPEWVIKLEYANRSFCNVAEYDIWHAVEGTPAEKFFAPVIDIDVWGGALIMKRTKPITQSQFDTQVKELPSFLHDNYYGNFGRIGKNIVCHDYGFHGALEHVKRARLKKVNNK